MIDKIPFKKIIFSLATAFLVVLIVLVATKTYTEMKGAKYIGLNSAIKNTLSVSASGEVFKSPDIAKIILSSVKDEKTAISAQTKVAKVMNAAIDFLKTSGLAEKDIKTTSYNIRPRYDYIKDQGRVFKGYEAKQTLEVKIRDLGSVGKILTGLAKRGVNTIGSVSYAIENEDTAKNEARSKAIAKAKKKAKNLAEDLGVDLVRLTSFSESWQGLPRFRGINFASSSGGSEMLPSPEVPMGENKVSVTVNLTYEIK